MKLSNGVKLGFFLGQPAASDLPINELRTISLEKNIPHLLCEEELDPTGKHHATGIGERATDVGFNHWITINSFGFFIIEIK